MPKRIMSPLTAGAPIWAHKLSEMCFNINSKSTIMVFTFVLLLPLAPSSVWIPTITRNHTCHVGVFPVEYCNT